MTSGWKTHPVHLFQPSKVYLELTTVFYLFLAVSGKSSLTPCVWVSHFLWAPSHLCCPDHPPCDPNHQSVSLIQLSVP